jgi:hypothetical protein
MHMCTRAPNEFADGAHRKPDSFSGGRQAFPRLDPFRALLQPTPISKQIFQRSPTDCLRAPLPPEISLNNHERSQTLAPVPCSALHSRRVLRDLTLATPVCESGASISSILGIFGNPRCASASVSRPWFEVPFLLRESCGRAHSI